MAVIVPTRRGTPRLGLGAGLVAAARGLAFTGLMLAGLGLLLVVLAAVLLTALGALLVIIGNGNPAFRIGGLLSHSSPGSASAGSSRRARCWSCGGWPA